MLGLNFLCFRNFRTFEKGLGKKKIKISFSCYGINIQFAHEWYDEQLQPFLKI